MITNKKVKYTKPMSHGLNDVVIAEGACYQGETAASPCVSGTSPTQPWVGCYPGSTVNNAVCFPGSTAAYGCTTGTGAG